MKINNWLLIVFCFTSFATHAQHDYDSQGVIFSDGGNVGIGISNPTRPLHVRGFSNVLQIDRNSDSPGIGLTRYSSDWNTVFRSFHLEQWHQDRTTGNFKLLIYTNKQVVPER